MIINPELYNKTPIWMFSGEDEFVEGSRTAYEFMEGLDPADLTYHEFQNHGHVIDDFAYFTNGFLEWFFSQKLKSDSVDNINKPIENLNHDLLQINTYSDHSSVTFQFSLPEKEQVSLEIFTYTGQKIKTIRVKAYAGEMQSLKWFTDGVKEGLYVARLSAGDYMKTKKFVLLH